MLCTSLYPMQTYRTAPGHILALISNTTSNVTAVTLISTWQLTLTPSLCHLQGGNPFRRFQQVAETRPHRSAAGGDVPRGPRSPGGLCSEPAILQ